MSRRKKTPRNIVLAIAQKQDPERFRNRTVKPEKGRGRKNRPRRNNVSEEILN